ncbi:MAG TPA: acetate kinase [Dermatophilaceae bacterium]|jgi:acetate kinase|nr:acetate kinase [Dermatophilaceae bacterium]HOF38129.1 acetate kinase [Dermatophilaceae bacterium]HOR17086.1 acetate kinase [Dermatophilaceae bacterium]HPK88450.1 acetate kinase [Dermatophilaceae bacterium]HPZ69138.1 acetate kinase [Dermatophilaceae bacterium]
MSALVLVLNAGSSSLKYQLLDADSGTVSASGVVERIGEPDAKAVARHTVSGEATTRDVDAPDHHAAMRVVLDAFATDGPPLRPQDLYAVGHRVVHGGDLFRSPAVVDDAVIDAIQDLVPLAPLHNPGNLAGIRAARAAFPTTPQVAVFDTAFHQTLPPHAFTYAVPREWRERHRVRRYGFHGTSHAFVSRRLATLLGRDVSETNVVVLHLGNGASAAAVAGGACIDTSMGLSPLEGLVMGTRPGDLDPALPSHLAREGVPIEDYDRALNAGSGLRGLTGTNDFREVERLIEAGDPDAALALDIVTYRIAKYVGSYAVALGRLDGIAFTAGIGEHSPRLRAEVLARLGMLGIRVDPDRNSGGPAERVVTSDDSAVPAWVVPTNEELEIARQTLAVLR